MPSRAARVRSPAFTSPSIANGSMRSSSLPNGEVWPERENCGLAISEFVAQALAGILRARLAVPTDQLDTEVPVTNDFDEALAKATPFDVVAAQAIVAFVAVQALIDIHPQRDEVKKAFGARLARMQIGVLLSGALPTQGLIARYFAAMLFSDVPGEQTS